MREMAINHERVLRAVHACGKPTGLADLLTATKGITLSPSQLRKVLDSLAVRSWLTVSVSKQSDRAGRTVRAQQQAWAVSEFAVPWLQQGKRLPRLLPAHFPGDKPRPAKSKKPRQRVRGIDRSYIFNSTWVPQASAPARAGAMDHKRHPSRGT